MWCVSSWGLSQPVTMHRPALVQSSAICCFSRGTSGPVDDLRNRSLFRDQEVEERLRQQAAHGCDVDRTETVLRSIAARMPIC
jgi:hypothetical protein